LFIHFVLVISLFLLGMCKIAKRWHFFLSIEHFRNSFRPDRSESGSGLDWTGLDAFEQARFIVFNGNWTLFYL